MATPHQKLKKDAWRWFSLYVRLKETERDGYGTCTTCGKRLHYKKLQAGHFVPGRTSLILFDERGVHIQCSGCNIWGSGKPAEYYAYMLKNYGQKVINEIYKNARKNYSYSDKELSEIRDRYKELAKKLLGTKSIA